MMNNQENNPNSIPSENELAHKARTDQYDTFTSGMTKFPGALDDDEAAEDNAYQTATERHWKHLKFSAVIAAVSLLVCFLLLRAPLPKIVMIPAIFFGIIGFSALMIVHYYIYFLVIRDSFGFFSGKDSRERLERESARKDRNDDEWLAVKRIMKQKQKDDAERDSRNQTH